MCPLVDGSVGWASALPAAHTWSLLGIGFSPGKTKLVVTANDVGRLVTAWYSRALVTTKSPGPAEITLYPGWDVAHGDVLSPLTGNKPGVV